MVALLLGIASCSPITKAFVDPSIFDEKIQLEDRFVVAGLVASVWIDFVKEREGDRILILEEGMEGNKDEARRCVGIAESAVASGDKERALKFIRIARRLNPDVAVDELIAACDVLEAPSGSIPDEETVASRSRREPDSSRSSEASDGHRSYTEEHVRLIREIRRHKDYYSILGVEKACSMEEIRRAYRKLSLKVHPDKNKAPGSEEAFKIVCKAFKCLSDDGLRRKYDQTGVTDDLEFAQQNSHVRRRATTRTNFYDDDFDPNEIFRSFFFGGQDNIFRAQHVYRTRTVPRQHRENAVEEGGFGFAHLLHILPVLFFFLLALIPFPDPEYTLQKTHANQIPMVTERQGVEYYVKASDFEQRFPEGSPSRANLEQSVRRDYRHMLSRHCRLEMQRRQWASNYPTPHCDKLRNFAAS